MGGVEKSRLHDSRRAACPCGQEEWIGIGNTRSAVNRRPDVEMTVVVVAAAAVAAIRMSPAAQLVFSFSDI